MSMIVKDTGSGGDFTPISEGIKIAVCSMVIDLGIQETSYGDKSQLFIQWQIPAERVEIKGENLPAVISQRYTASLNEKANLRKTLEAWRSRKFTEEELSGFDMSTILGAGCQIQVVHNKSQDGTKTYANIGSIMGLPPGTSAPPIEGQPISYSRSDGETTVAAALPNFIRKWCGLPELGVSHETSREPGSDDGPVEVPFNDALPPVGDDQQIPF